MTEMDQKAKESNLTGLERIKKFRFASEPFSVDNDMLTPTFKLKRNISKKVYTAQIAEMYAEPLWTDVMRWLDFKPSFKWLELLNEKNPLIKTLNQN